MHTTLEDMKRMKVSNYNEALVAVVEDLQRGYLVITDLDEKLVECFINLTGKVFEVGVRVRVKLDVKPLSIEYLAGKKGEIIHLRSNRAGSFVARVRLDNGDPTLLESGVNTGCLEVLTDDKW